MAKYYVVAGLRPSDGDDPGILNLMPYAHDTIASAQSDLRASLESEDEGRAWWIVSEEDAIFDGKRILPSSIPKSNYDEHL